MNTYATADWKDRWKAIVAVVLIHLVLGAAIIVGLNVPTIRRTVEHMTTIDIAPPPPPLQAQPVNHPERAAMAEGAAAKKADPTEVVAPRSIFPPPSPVIAAPVAASGSASTSGAALTGTGTGAGGSGAGPGGGGSGDTSRFTPARLMRNFSRRDYSILSAMRREGGAVPAHIVISSAGTIIECAIIRSSGDLAIDATVCERIRASLRFAPARDATGRAIEYNFDYLARWGRF
ncbi:MAG: energy transducer TonB [Sphingomicrobium sp.]